MSKAEKESPATVHVGHQIIRIREYISSVPMPMRKFSATFYYCCKCQEPFAVDFTVYDPQKRYPTQGELAEAGAAPVDIPAPEKVIRCRFAGETVAKKNWDCAKPIPE